jgi:hypothetical protein
LKDTILALRVYIRVVVISILAILMLAAQLALVLIGADNAALRINRALSNILDAERAKAITPKRQRRNDGIRKV